MMNDETRNVTQGQRIGLISYSGEPAGLTIRVAAGIVDVFILHIVFFGTYTLWYNMTLSPSIEWILLSPPGLRCYFYLLLPLIYFVPLQKFSGFTPGKFIFGLRVVNSISSSPSWLQLLKRFACYYLSIIPLGVGYLLMSQKQNGMALHDRISGTSVITFGNPLPMSGFVLIMIFGVTAFSPNLNPHDTGMSGPWFLPWMDYQILTAKSPLRQKVDTARSELLNLANPIESYYIDYGIYPYAAQGTTWDPVIPSATDPTSAGYMPRSLTTPIIQISSLPDDPFNSFGTQDPAAPKTFAYRYACLPKTGWILCSNGPDQAPDFDLHYYVDPKGAGCDIKKYLTQYGGKYAEYDPTNGTTSRGDIFITGP